MNRHHFKIIEAVAAGKVDRVVVANARFVVAEHKQSQKRKRERSAPHRRADEAARLEARAIRDRIREQVMARSRGTCELCGARPVDALEWHHLLPGPNRRRFEATSTTLATCMDCHRAWHRGGLEVLQRSLAWARENGTTMVVQDLEKRIARRKP